jgi:hypothetical protein
VADARTLLVGRAYRLALDTLRAVADYVEPVPAELKAQYNSLHSHALVGTGRQASEAELQEPAASPDNAHAISSGLTLPQMNWTLTGAGLPAAPSQVLLHADHPEVIATIPTSGDQAQAPLELAEATDSQQTLGELDAARVETQAVPVRSRTIYWIIAALLALVAIAGAARLFVPRLIATHCRPTRCLTPCGTLRTSRHRTGLDAISYDRVIRIAA